MARERGGRFPIAADEGLALSEFIDSAGVNHPETAPLHAVPPEPDRQRDFSYLYVAAGAAILIGLFLFFRRR